MRCSGSSRLTETTGKDEQAITGIPWLVDQRIVGVLAHLDEGRDRTEIAVLDLAEYRQVIEPRQHFAILLVTLAPQVIDPRRHLADETAVVVHELIEQDEDQASDDRSYGEREEVAVVHRRCYEIDREGGEQGPAPERHKPRNSAVLRHPETRCQCAER